MSVADLGQLDEMIHGRIRLGVMVYLANAEVADFTELKLALEATQGNLSVHLRKLEEAGYVEIDKRFVDKKPRTQIRLTAEGRRAFRRYLDVMGSLIGKGESPTDR